MGTRVQEYKSTENIENIENYNTENTENMENTENSSSFEQNFFLSLIKKEKIAIIFVWSLRV